MVLKWRIMTSGKPIGPTLTQKPEESSFVFLSWNICLENGFLLQLLQLLHPIVFHSLFSIKIENFKDPLSYSYMKVP